MGMNSSSGNLSKRAHTLFETHSVQRAASFSEDHPTTLCASCFELLGLAPQRSPQLMVASKSLGSWFGENLEQWSRPGPQKCLAHCLGFLILPGPSSLEKQKLDPHLWLFKHQDIVMGWGKSFQHQLGLPTFLVCCVDQHIFGPSFVLLTWAKMEVALVPHLACLSPGVSPWKEQTFHEHVPIQKPNACCKFSWNTHIDKSHCSQCSGPRSCNLV